MTPTEEKLLSALRGAIAVLKDEGLGEDAAFYEDIIKELNL